MNTAIQTNKKFKVISFDLDDTLYDNSEVIRLAEQQCVTFLANAAQLADLDLDTWQFWKQQVFNRNPILCENVTAWRIQTIFELLTFHGKSAVEIENISNETMQHFMEYRHKINVPQQNIAVLNRLKQHYPLAVITNGNVNPAKIGLNQFDLVLCGGVQGRAKPHSDLFKQTATHFQVELQDILHVGDNLITDVDGAIQAGCQAVWINLTGQHFEDFPERGALPSWEINNLADLLTLIN